MLIWNLQLANYFLPRLLFYQYHRQERRPSMATNIDTAQQNYHNYCNTLIFLNSAFTIMFSVECVLKIMAFGPKVSTLPLAVGGQ